MENKSRNARILHLLVRFINKETQATRFVSNFMKLWKENRDSQAEIKKTWKEPFDEKLQAALFRNEISKEDFTSRWLELWGISSERDRAFLEMIDRIFTACDMFRKEPESKFELNETQLRSFVAKALSTYLRSLANQKEVGVRR
jgi:DnaJ-domain-containing protein 1